MSKKPVICKEAQVLLKLLRIALGTEPRKYFGEVVEPFPDNIDWKEVVRLSYEHKVSAIAVDGLEASKYDPYQGLCFDGLSNLNEKQTEELKAVLVPWIKDVENTEWSYCYYVEVLKTLCQIFKDNGLTPIILKGYGLSLNYPRPSHRGAGDIDIYLLDENGNCAAARGDQMMKEQFGIESTNVNHDKDEEHHSIFTFKGITVENHYELVSTFFNLQKDDILRNKLEGYILNSKPQTADSSIFLPQLEFNAVYLMQHMYAHFYFGIVNLRQFVDWFLFVREYGNKVNWSEVKENFETTGLIDFAKGLKGVLSQLFLTSEVVPNISEDKTLSEKLIVDIFNFGPKHEAGIKNLFMFYKDRWHYKYFNNQCWLLLTISHINQSIKHFLLGKFGFPK